MSYTTWPSAFGLAEYPMHQINTLWNKGWNVNTHGDKELKNRIEQAAYWLNHAYQHEKKLLVRCTWNYLKLQAETQLPKVQVVGALIGAQIAYPILLAATPITMVMDIVAGVAESTLRLFQGRAAEIPSILHKKVIASPVQHLTFLTVNLLLVLIFNTGAIAKAQEARVPFKSMVKWMTVLPSILAAPFYGIGQETVAQNLPDWTHPDHFLIFIEGGAENMEGKKYTDPAEDAYQRYYSGAYTNYRYSTRVDPDERHQSRRNWGHQSPRMEQAPPVPNKSPLEMKEVEWQDFLKGLKVSDSTVVANKRDAYEQFKHLIGTKKSLLEVYGLKSNELTKDAIQKQFRKFAPILHTDKHLDREAEARELFQALAHGRASLEDYLDNK